MTKTATKLKAVVFDFDGVVLESLEVKTEAFRSLFSDEPEHVERIVQLHVENPGVSRYDKFRTIYGEFLDRPLDDEEMARLDARFSELVFERVIACDFVVGAREFIARAAEQHELYVASATPEEELKRIIEARELTPFFAGVGGSPRTKEEIVRSVLADRGIEPSEAVFVGDATTDMLAARAAGVPFVGRMPRDGSDPFGDVEIVRVADLAELDARWAELTVAPPPVP